MFIKIISLIICLFLMILYFYKTTKEPNYMNEDKEIERKFIVDESKLPSKYDYEIDIKQGYFKDSPISIKLGLNSISLTHIDKYEFKLSDKHYNQLKTAIDDNSEITSRIRLVDSSSAILTFKVGSGITRGEVEFKIDYSAGVELYLICKYKLEKTRKILTIDGNKWEIDFFKNIDLVLAEFEHKDLSIVMNVEQPEFIDKEVTEDKNYSNLGIAKSIC